MGRQGRQGRQGRRGRRGGPGGPGGQEGAGDAAFARAFERGEVGGLSFHHVSHLRLALAYLDECDTVEQATERMASALGGFAAAAGHPEKYHHTITVFWMRVLARLLDKDLPLEYYSPERLWSDEARSAWLEPDRKPLEVNPRDAASSD